MKGYAVIGANYGDEGKGLITDYLTRQVNNPLVVRYNGGAQAGHTVTLPNGKRHIFSHIGSGTLAGAPTYLSEFFISNPILFNRECDVLANEHDIVPMVYISDKSIITTPFDMMINRAVETTRGNGRHGSCGYGIFETIHRDKHPGFHFRISDLVGWNIKQLREYLEDVRNLWVPRRIHALGLNMEVIDKDFYKDDLIDNFMEHCETFVGSVVLHEPKNDHTWIFEGAQGLALDMNNKSGFPNLTPSNTGLKNIIHLSKKFGIDELDVHYITRTYLTRHGEGILPNEMDMGLTCPTNVENPWQGKLRYAPLDTLAVMDRIVDDMCVHKDDSVKMIGCLDITHTDVGIIPIIDKFGELSLVDAKNIPYDFQHNIEADGLFSRGPTHKDIFSY